MFLAVILIFTAFIIYIFVSRKRSPVPYFPTNKKDVPLIIKALNLEKNKSIVDLGAGNGIVIFKAASEAYKRGFDTKFYAVEINPVLVFIMNIRKLFHKNKKNIYILSEDFTKMSLKKFKNAVFYLYLSPKYLDIVYQKIKKEASNPKIISYFYKTNERIDFIKIKGENNLYVTVS
ncbi:MAG: rRNA adenine N-6-methyltransferase family protein [bacterium]|nr:rRNA adenine N-6-methyltransferase family protein [bacterium]